MQELNIEFMADEWHDQHRRKVVWFTAIVDEKSIDCGISIDALAYHFGAYYDNPLPAFRANRERIEAVAAKLINQRRFEDDGKIMINSADL
ncbi:MAG TPA: DUF1488 domain-containing protein [Methylomirabilota bacterium]|nr:DUF1488 domain-containing protein [Methylomirabilota bacterium]